MTALAPPATTPWAAGRLHGDGPATLLFGRMFEDPSIELGAFSACAKVLAIASAGDVAMALAAAGHQVTAIDVNRAQVAYVEDRLAGGPARRGQADRLLAAGRAALRIAGWRGDRLERLSSMRDPAAQVAAWRTLTAGASGAALRALLAPAALRLGYHGDFARSAAGIRNDLPRRIGRGMAAHSNADNPWARLLLTGSWPCDLASPLVPAGSIHLVVADVAAHLESVPPGTYDAFALSNVLDGAPDRYRCRLFAALARAATPGAVAVLRTLAVPASATEAAAAVHDRALLWGGIQVAAADQLR